MATAHICIVLPTRHNITLFAKPLPPHSNRSLHRALRLVSSSSLAHENLYKTRRVYGRRWATRRSTFWAAQRTYGIILDCRHLAEAERSSGSYRAAQYASQYPHRVGRFILDAVSPHGMVRFAKSSSKVTNNELSSTDYLHPVSVRH